MKRTKKQPFVSIIIPTYNDERTLHACIGSLLRLDYPTYEVIFAYDKSKDNTLKILKEYTKKDKKIRIVQSNNRGVAGARNTGMKAAKGDIFVFSDADCTFYKYWPTRLVKALEDPKVGAVGGRDKAPPGEPLIKRCIDYTMTSFIATGGLRGSKHRLAKYAVTGCNFAVRKDVVDKVGMHDERIVGRGEEKEWCQRIRDAGYDIKFVLDSFVLHYRRISLKAFWIQTYKSGVARYNIFKAAPNSLELVHIAPSMFILFLIASGGLALISKYFLFAFVLAISVYTIVLIAQSIIGTLKLKSLLAFAVIPITTVIMQFAYGIGFLVKLIFKK